MIILGALGQQYASGGGASYTPEFDVWDLDLTNHFTAHREDSWNGTTWWNNLSVGNDGGVNSSPLFTDFDGELERIRFDGTDDYISIANSANTPRLQPGQSGTLVFVWKDITAGLSAEVLGSTHREGSGSTSPFGYVQVETDGTVRFYASALTYAPYGYSVFSSPHVNFSGWNILALTYDIPASTGTLEVRFCLNGNLETKTTTMVIDMGPNTGFDFDIGRLRNYIWGENYGHFELNTFRSHSSKVSDAQLLNIYNYYSTLLDAAAGENVLQHHPDVKVLLDYNNPGATPDTWEDISGNGNHFVKGGASMPTLSGDGFRFPNDSNYYFAGPNIAGMTAIDMHVRMKNDPSYNNGGVLYFGTDGGLNDHHPYSNQYYYAVGSTSQKSCGTSVVSPTNWHTSYWRSAPNDWAFFMNETLVHATASNTVGFPTTPKLGLSLTSPYYGWMRKMALFNVLQNADQRAIIRTWMQA